MWTSTLLLAAFAAKTFALFNLDNAPNAVGICYSVWHSLGYSGT
jgi:multidrug transporter EmrE-like cation transporter